MRRERMESRERVMVMVRKWEKRKVLREEGCFRDLMRRALDLGLGFGEEGGGGEAVGRREWAPQPPPRRVEESIPVAENGGRRGGVRLGESEEKIARHGIKLTED